MAGKNAQAPTTTTSQVLRIVVLVGLAWLAGASARPQVVADTVTLRSGEVLKCKLSAESADQVEITIANPAGTASTVRIVPRADMAAIEGRLFDQKQQRELEGDSQQALSRQLPHSISVREPVQPPALSKVGQQPATGARLRVVSTSLGAATQISFIDRYWKWLLLAVSGLLALWIFSR